MPFSYHHKNASCGMIRQGYAKETCDVVGTSECFVRQMTDEDFDHLHGLIAKRKVFSRGHVPDNPNEQSEGAETPHEGME